MISNEDLPWINLLGLLVNNSEDNDVKDMHLKYKKMIEDSAYIKTSCSSYKTGMSRNSVHNKKLVEDLASTSRSRFLRCKEDSNVVFVVFGFEHIKC